MRKRRGKREWEAEEGKKRWGETYQIMISSVTQTKTNHCTCRCHYSALIDVASYVLVLNEYSD